MVEMQPKDSVKVVLSKHPEAILAGADAGDPLLFLTHKCY